MRILIDADGCPVVNQAIRLGNRAGLEVILLCDTSPVSYTHLTLPTKA